MNDRFVSPAELAAIWGVSPSFVRKRCALPPRHPDHLPSVQLGTRKVIRLSAAEKYVADRETVAIPQKSSAPSFAGIADRLGFFD